jgi:hypothetical protein
MTVREIQGLSVGSLQGGGERGLHQHGERFGVGGGTFFCPWKASPDHAYYMAVEVGLEQDFESILDFLLTSRHFRPDSTASVLGEMR